MPRPIRVALFTDTLGDVNGVSRFIRNVGDEALATGRDLHVVTSTRFEVPDRPNIHVVEPTAAMRMPRYENLELVLPPARRLLALARDLAPDAIHVSTPGSVGMIGFWAARRLGVPVLGVYHTDFPAYVERLFQDDGATWACARFMRGVYTRFARVFTRSADYARALLGLGVREERIVRLRPGIDVSTFHVRHRDDTIWRRLAAPHPSSPPARVRVLSVGRVSVEKNLPFLARVWREAGPLVPEAELVVVGDGPYRSEMERDLRGTRTTFLGFRHGPELSTLYASSDLFVFPSVTDTLGQVVMEAQSSGMPVLVSDQGGPKEVVRDGECGLVLPAADARAWVDALVGLVRDDARRRAMGRAAAEAMKDQTIRASFEHFWSVHEACARGE